MNAWTEENDGFELEATEEVTTQELDAIVTSLREARLEYDKAKALSSEKSKAVDSLESQLIHKLGQAKKSSYIVDGIGRVTLVPRASVKTPKSFEDKLKLFNWIKENKGEDELIALQSIHSATINSMYNNEMNACIETNRPFNGIDGLEEPTITTTLQFRGEK